MPGFREAALKSAIGTCRTDEPESIIFAASIPVRCTC